MPGYRHKSYITAVAVGADGEVAPTSAMLQHPFVLRTIHAVVNHRDGNHMTDEDRAAVAGMLVMIGSPETFDLMLMPVGIDILTVVRDEPCLNFDDEPVFNPDGTPKTYEAHGLDLPYPSLLTVESLPIAISWADKPSGIACNLVFMLVGSENAHPRAAPATDEGPG